MASPHPPPSAKRTLHMSMCQDSRMSQPINDSDVHSMSSMTTSALGTVDDINDCSISEPQEKKTKKTVDELVGVLLFIGRIKTHVYDFT